MGRERRRRSRRNSGQRAVPPGMLGAPVPGMEPLDEPGAAPDGRAARTGSTSRAAPVQVRSDRIMERETATMISEMKRVGVVSAVCFGMLAVLVVVERMQ